MIDRLRTIVRAVSRDLPWSPARPRLSLVFLLLVMGLPGGAIQGLLFYQVLRKDFPGDVFAWHLIEFSAWQGAALGLAVGAALATTRHLAGRLALGTLLGFLGITAFISAFSQGQGVTAVGSAIRDAFVLPTEKPEGWGLTQGAPLGFALTLVCHLTRRAVSRPWTLPPVLVVGFLLAWRTHAVVWMNRWTAPTWTFWDAGMASAHLAGATILIVLLGEGCLIAEVIAAPLSRLTVQAQRVAAAACLAVPAIFSSLCDSMPFVEPSAVEALSMTPDGEFVVSAHRGGVLRLWRVRDDSIPEVGMIRTQREPFLDTKVAVSPGMAAVWTSDGRISLWQVGPFRQLDELSIDEEQRGDLILAPDGRTLIYGLLDERMRYWDIRPQPDGSVDTRLWMTNETMRCWRETPTVAEPRFSADGEVLIRIYRDAVRYLDRSKGQILKSIPLEYPIFPYRDGGMAACAPDGSAVAMQSARGTVLLIRLPTGEVRDSFDIEEWRLLVDLDFSPDGQDLTVASATHTKRWHASTMRCEQEWTPVAGGSPIRRLKYFPDGKRILLGMADGSLRIVQLSGKGTDATASR